MFLQYMKGNKVQTRTVYIVEYYIKKKIIFYLVYFMFHINNVGRIVKETKPNYVLISFFFFHGIKMQNKISQHSLYLRNVAQVQCC